MKKLLILIVVLGVIGGIWFVTHSQNSSNTTVINSNPVKNSHPSALNATFTLDDNKVPLKNGVFTDANGSEIDLTDIAGYGDLNGDGKEDAAVTLIQSGAGTGVFFSIAAFVSGPISYKGTNAIFLGDRIQPKSITIKNKTITVTYLDRSVNQAMTDEPNMLITKTFTYSSLDNTISE
jgi:hypothetical protein